MTDLLILAGMLALFLLLSPCSPWSLWRSGCTLPRRSGTSSGDAMIPTITPREVQALIEAGNVIDLIDVRTPGEFARVHALGARSAPLDRLDPAAVAATRRAPAEQPIYLICQAGGRSAQACLLFQAAGIATVRNVAGGTAAWMAAGLPTASGDA